LLNDAATAVPDAEISKAAVINLVIHFSEIIAGAKIQTFAYIVLDEVKVKRWREANRTHSMA
jgi:hypothetical protein